MKKIFSFVTVLMALLGTFSFMSCDKDEETTTNYVIPAHMWFAGPGAFEKLADGGSVSISAGAGSGAAGFSGLKLWHMTALDFMPDGTLLVYDLYHSYSSDSKLTAFEHNPEWGYFVGAIADKFGKPESPRKYHYILRDKDHSVLVTDDKGKEWEYGILYADIDAHNNFSKFKNSEGKILFVDWDPTSGEVNSDLFK